MRLLFVLLIVLASSLVHARTRAPYQAEVTSVVDGDSVWIRRHAHGKPIEVRLLGIDAPESCQAWGPQARDALRHRVLSRTVTVHERARDTYGRHLARLDQDGRDVNAWLVEQGHAWAARWHGQPGTYAAQEERAAAARRGLWAQARPMEPRRFRRLHGRCGHSH